MNIAGDLLIEMTATCQPIRLGQAPSLQRILSASAMLESQHHAEPAYSEIATGMLCNHCADTKTPVIAHKKIKDAFGHFVSDPLPLIRWQQHQTQLDNR